MWMNLRYTFTSPAQTDSAEWCAEQTVIALGVFSISVAKYVVFGSLMCYRIHSAEHLRILGISIYICTHPHTKGPMVACAQTTTNTHGG